MHIFTHKGFYILTISLAVLVISFGFLIQNAYGLRSDDICKDVEVIFARGSGQNLVNDESSRFFKQLESRIPDDKISRSFYELGLEEYGGHKYTPIGVADVFDGNAIGAWASAGYGNDYGKSVDAGVGELQAYLTARDNKCKSSDTRYVLGGYSQGAQVVGQTLPKLSDDLRGRIVFAALFGDPKLHLPEGEGFNPPACRGKEFSSWRRIIGTCDTDNGSLGARKPYLPADMQNKTGLWCYLEDFVCGTTKSYKNNNGHGRYALEGHAVDIAVSEIITQLATALPAEQAAHLIRMEGVGAGSSDLDIAFVLDTTGSMSYQIEESKAFIRASAEKIKQLNGRIALTVYKDFGDEYTTKVVSGLSSDTTELLAALDGVYASGGGDLPEAALHALTTTFNSLDWKNGATKATILLTDAPYHDPDLVDGSTAASVAGRSMEIDPVNIYPVVPAYVADYYQSLAEQTSGQVIVDTGNTLSALTTALTKIEQRPTVILKNPAYYAQPGQEITFDASESSVIDATITHYDWDFDGDGVFDRTTTSPQTDYTYTADFDGILQVRATADNDTISSTTAIVTVNANPLVASQLPAPTNVTYTVAPIAPGDTSRVVTIAWQPTTPLPDDGWSVALNGVALGTLTNDRTSLEIRDVLFDETTLAVAGISSDGSVGEYASVTVPAYVAPIPPVVTTPKLTWYQKLIIAIKLAIRFAHHHWVFLR